MAWIKISERLPKHDQWCWICAPKNWIERACFDLDQKRWILGEGDYNWTPKDVTHWQPYFTPAPPDPYDVLVETMKNGI